MKKILLMTMLLAAPQFSHAFLDHCTKENAYLIPQLQVIEAPRCLGGMALIDGENRIRCTHSQTAKLVGPGVYRACVEFTQFGLIINDADLIGAE